MSAPTPPPKYIYKILPADPAPPSPLPTALPISALDARDNFLHMSTSAQILGTLNAFFTDAPHVYILRVPYTRIAEHVKWEDANGLSPDEPGGCWDLEGRLGYFPHVYANGPDGDLKLGRDEVDRLGKWERGEAGWAVGGWCFDEDAPKST